MINFPWIVNLTPNFSCVDCSTDSIKLQSRFSNYFNSSVVEIILRSNISTSVVKRVLILCQKNLKKSMQSSN